MSWLLGEEVVSLLQPMLSKRIMKTKNVYFMNCQFYEGLNLLCTTFALGDVAISVLRQPGYVADQRYEDENIF